MNRNWVLQPRVPEAVLDKYDKQLDPLIAQLLYNRGVVTMERLGDFLSPTYEGLHSPFLFSAMERAVLRVWEAIDRGERICIYGDYDADAVTANAVLQQTFGYLHTPVESYIPDRFTEGYGLNVEAFEKLKERGVTLAITVDCGTNSVEVAEFCLNNGIDLIITDHHEITGLTPNAYALINPKNPAEVYPDHQITGVGVAYKLARALLMNKERVVARRNVSLAEFVDWDKWLLDLVAIGTVADCHSLMGENRILVSYGLRVLAKTKWVGLRALMNIAGVDTSGKLDTYTLGFILAPRINAAGRLEHADNALRVLMAASEDEALLYASNLELINKRRQDLTMRVVSEAREEALKLSHRKFLLLSHPEWPKGLVGLAAGKLAEEFKKPVIVLEQGEEESTGSARSVGNFDIVECLKESSDLLVRFGGHKQAAGLTVKTKNIASLYDQIIQFTEIHMSQADLTIPLLLEAELGLDQLTVSLAELIEQLGPFGVGNPKPLFLLKNAALLGFKVVGKTQQHVQITFGVGGRSVQSIAFNMAERMQVFSLGDRLDLAVELLVDAYRGSKQLKLRIIDIRPVGVLAGVDPEYALGVLAPV